MKKALILLTSAVFMMALAAAPGCSGGGDDDDDDDDGALLHTGTYTVSGASFTSTCSTGGASYYSGVAEADVAVTGAAILITGFADDLGYDIVGSDLADNTFGTPVTVPLDYSDNTSADYPLDSGNEYACTVDLTTEYAGNITGTDAFTLVDSFALTTSGGGCNVAVVSSAFTSPVLAVPCSSTDGADFAL